MLICSTVNFSKTMVLKLYWKKKKKPTYLNVTFLHSSIASSRLIKKQENERKITYGFGCKFSWKIKDYAKVHTLNIKLCRQRKNYFTVFITNLKCQVSVFHGLLKRTLKCSFQTGLKIYAELSSNWYLHQYFSL